jgi:hypothetical protein
VPPATARRWTPAIDGGSQVRAEADIGRGVARGQSQQRHTDSFQRHGPVCDAWPLMELGAPREQRRRGVSHAFLTTGAHRKVTSLRPQCKGRLDQCSAHSRCTTCHRHAVPSCGCRTPCPSRPAPAHTAKRFRCWRGPRAPRAPCGRCPAPSRAGERATCVRHAAHRCHEWTSPVQAGDRAVHVVTDMATTAATTLLSCTAFGDLPWTLNWQTWVASLGSPFPLLAQEVLELLHQLLRVEVFVTQWARLLVNRRVIVLL